MDNILETLRLINNRLTNIEGNLVRLEEKLDLSLAIQRNHLIRVKNGEQLTDDMILLGRPYNDLTPDKAYSIYKNNDIDYMVLDVSQKTYQAPGKLDSTVKIPFEELEERCSEITSKTTPILVISEDGVTSILACELLVKRGYFNINNVSGGFKFWPGFRFKDSKATA